MLQYQARDLAGAEQSFKKSLEVDPKYVNGASALGTLYQSQQRWGDAEQQFRRAISMEPKTVGFRWALARLYLAQGKKDDAEKVLQQAKQEIDSTAGYRVLGDYYLGSGQRDRALAEFAALTSQHPKDAEIKKSYILLLMQAGRLDEANKINDEVLKKTPRDTDSLALKGEILIAQGHASEAVQPLETALKARPENPGLHYQLALAAQAAADSNKYEAQLREVVRLDPRNTDAWERLGRVAISKNDATEAERAGNAIIAATPKSPAGYVMRAGSQLMRGEQNKAELDIKQAIDVAPNSAIGYSKLAELRLMQKKVPEAEKFFLKAHELDAKAYEPVGGLVQVYTIQKQVPRAIATLNDFLQKSPNNSGAYLTLATLLGTTHDLAGAEKALLKAVELDKKNVNSYRLLTGLYQAEGNQPKVEDAYNQWIMNAPRDPMPLVAFGAFEQEHGNMKQAEELFTKALQLQPENPAAANNMAYLLLQQNRDIDQAITLAQIARRAAPTSPAIADTLAWAYVQKGLPSSAIGLLQEAVKSNPANPAFHYHLGVAYGRTGDKDRARTELEQVIKLNPNFQPDDVKKALAEVGRS
jgi:tetratricopeptide (TPR) repeat protein